MLRTLKKVDEIRSKKDFANKLEPVDIPNRWKKHMYDLIVEDTVDAGSFDNYRSVAKNWSWINLKTDTFWIVIEMLDTIGAASVSMIVDWIIDDYEIPDPDPKTIASMNRGVRRTLKRLHKCRVITMDTLDEEILGHDLYTVSIYKSPWCTPRQYELTEEQYVKAGGIKRRKKRKIPKSNDYVVKKNLERSEKFKKKKFEKEVNQDAKKNIFYSKCPVCETIFRYTKDDILLYKINGTKIEENCSSCDNSYRELILPKNKNKFLDRIVGR